MNDIILDMLYRRRKAALALAICGVVFPFLLLFFSGMGLTVLLTDQMKGALRARSALPVSIKAQATLSWFFAVVLLPFVLISASLPMMLIWNWGLGFNLLENFRLSQLPTIAVGVLGLTSLYWLIPLLAGEARARGWWWAILLLGALFGVFGIAPGIYFYSRVGVMFNLGFGLEWLLLPIFVAGYRTRTRVYLNMLRWTEIMAMNGQNAQRSHISWWNSFYSPIQLMVSILCLSPLVYAVYVFLQHHAHTDLWYSYVSILYLFIYLAGAVTFMAWVGSSIRALRVLPITGLALATRIWLASWGLVLAAAVIASLLSPAGFGITAFSATIFFGGLLTWYVPTALRHGARLSPYSLMAVLSPACIIGVTLLSFEVLSTPLYLLATLQLALSPLSLRWLRHDLTQNSDAFLPDRIPNPYARKA